MENRRNYYRVLQVQPDAAPALIKASYRTLMQKLKFHPDLGGDQWNAALVNEAYYILSHEKRRANYDAQMGEALFPRGDKKEIKKDKPEPPIPAANERVCLFCHHLNDDLASQFCSECQSPLDPVIISNIDQELRRAISRVEMNEAVQYYTQWPQNPLIGELLDASPVGMGMNVHEPVTHGQVIKIESMVLSAVGEIVHLGQHNGNNQGIGLRLLTASFHCDQGTFLNVAI